MHTNFYFVVRPLMFFICRTFHFFITQLRVILVPIFELFASRLQSASSTIWWGSLVKHCNFYWFESLIVIMYIFMSTKYFYSSFYFEFPFAHILDSKVLASHFQLLYYWAWLFFYLRALLFTTLLADQSSFAHLAEVIFLCSFALCLLMFHCT